MLNFRGSVVYLRKQRRDDDEQNAGNDTAEHGKGDELIVFLPGFFQFSRPKQLSYYDAHRAAQRSKDHIGDIAQGVGDIFCGDHIQTQHGIALCQERQCQRPKQFVEEQRGSDSQELFDKTCRHVKTAIKILDKWQLIRMPVCPYDDDGKFYKSGQHRGDGGAFYAQSRCAEFSEDQNIIEYQVDKNGDDAADHRYNGSSCFAEGTGINLRHGAGQHADQHNQQVVPSVGQSGGKVAVTFSLMKKGFDEGIAERNQN